jgi:starch phosphorylase
VVRQGHARFRYLVFQPRRLHQAVEQKFSTENISRVLYPNDSAAAGKELRLKQEYFLVSATLQDVLSRTALPPRPLQPARSGHLPDERHAPRLAVAELMRVLCDEHGMPWIMPGL